MSNEKAPRFSLGDRVLILGNDEHEGRIVGWHNDSAIVELAQPIVTTGGDIFSTVVAHTGNFGTLGGPFSDSVYKAEIRRLRRMYLDTANELAGLREGAFQAHEQHDADQAENARLTAELTALKTGLQRLAEGYHSHADANAGCPCETCNIRRRTLNEKEEGGHNG